jgi:cytochrome c oxidase cbb3-type subunit III
MSRPYSCHKLPWALAAIAALLSLGGCNRAPGRPGSNPEVPRPEDVQDFLTLYEHNCSGCHGAAGRGGPAVSLADPTYLALADDATLRRVTADGVPGTLMPSFARAAGGMLTDRQIDDLVRGMRSHWGATGALRTPNMPPYQASPGDANRGAGVYETYCASCHGPGGQGGSKAHSIVDGSYLALVSDQGLRTTVVVGVPDRGAPDWRSNVPGRPMSAQEISDVVAWLEAQRSKFPGQPYPSISRYPAGGSQ